MKRVLGILLAAVLVLWTTAVFAAAGSDDTVTITFTVTANAGAMTAKVKFTYDTSVLEFAAANGMNGWTAPQNGNGSFGIANADSVIPLGDIGTVTFRIRPGTAPGQYPVNAVVERSIDTNYQTVSMSVSGGVVTVDSAAVPEDYSQPDTSSYSAPDDSSQDVYNQYASGYPCQGYTTVRKLNVRQSASSSARVITNIPYNGTYLTILGEAYDQSGELWYNVQLSSGETGYSMSRYISKDTSSNQQSYNSGGYSGGQAKTNVEKVIVRSQPKTGSREVVRIEYAGTTVSVLGQEYDSTGKLWINVITNDGYQGYIQSRYLDYPNGRSIELQSLNDGKRGTFSTVNAELVRGKRFNVYSGPGQQYLRGAEGRAAMSSNDSAYVYGKEGGWVLVQYYISTNHWRFGYVSDSLIAYGTVPDLAFTRTGSTVSVTTTITDDPLYSRSALTTISAGTPVTILGYLDDWAYIEAGNVRGFVPGYTVQ